MQRQVHVYYTGRVQGVGFRFTAESIARAQSVNGYVRNLPDGRVEIVAEAEEQVLKGYLAAVNGQFSSYIRDTDISWEAASGDLKEFYIKP